MGREAECVLHYRGRRLRGRALLETDAILFRGPERLSIPLRALTGARARSGQLVVTFGGETARFELGAVAAAWAQRILRPPTLLDKLGVRAGARVALCGLDEPTFARDLEARVSSLRLRLPAPDTDLLFLPASTRRDLERIPRLEGSLAPKGALWVVYPRGRPEVTERDVLEAGRACGLVDVKVVRFSETHTALKFVRRVLRG